MSARDKETAIKFLEDLLKIVRAAEDVDPAEWDMRAHSSTHYGRAYITQEPDGWQTHTIKVRANVGARAEAAK